MSGPGKWQERAAANIRERHESKIRELAADLERGRVPTMRNLLDDALEISRRVAALEAMQELMEVYLPEPMDEG